MSGRPQRWRPERPDRRNDPRRVHSARGGVGVADVFGGPEETWDWETSFVSLSKARDTSRLGPRRSPTPAVEWKPGVPRAERELGTRTSFVSPPGLPESTSVRSRCGTPGLRTSIGRSTRVPASPGDRLGWTLGCKRKDDGNRGPHLNCDERNLRSLWRNRKNSLLTKKRTRSSVRNPLSNISFRNIWNITKSHRSLDL